MVKVKTDTIEVWKAKIIEQEHIDEVLEDIKADIQNLIDDTDSIYGTSALHKALEIIDNHISGKENNAT